MNIIHNIAMRDLPPFDSLLAFESALRLGSMTAAAAELGVTQSAISHRLRRLEGFTGAPLLSRLRPGLAVTPAGAALSEALAGILDQMAGLRERCRSAAAPPRLRVGSGSALIHHWLVRRLPAFAAIQPDLEVALVVLTNKAEARSPDLDLRLLWGPRLEQRNTSTQRMFPAEAVFPVCAPHLLPDGQPLAAPARLANLRLIHKGPEGRPGQAQEWEWKTWFNRVGAPGAPRATVRFEDIGPAISAALEGAGVVLARSLLVQDALSDGRLARVLDPIWDMPSSKAHVVSWPAALIADSRVRDFTRWLVAEAEKSSAAISRLTSGSSAPG